MHVHVKRGTAIPINEQGQCVVAVEVTPETELQGCTWECSKKCKPNAEYEVDGILSLKTAFDLSVENVRAALNTCNCGCPYGHYTNCRKGRPIVCYRGGECGSQVRILRAASTHFPKLRAFLRQVNSAIVSHKCVCEIDQVLGTGDYSKLMKMAGIKNIESLLGNDVDHKYEEITHDNSYLRQPDLEDKLIFTHAALITEFKKEIDDFPEHVCCCCERLNQRKSISVVRFSDNFNSDVWHDLKCHILKNTPNAAKQVLYMCYYCKNMIKNNKMPPRCVLNGLQNVPIPPELAVLDPFSRQLIQHAEGYQTIVRLGTYTGKVPRI